ncbi:MAG: hypothetical protein MJA29_10650 [Candidatus Omnitrophica bacterium]|nr:hypothetical protein [Candidatus Omnitrophota bacterium]
MAKRGSALMLSYMVITVLAIISTAFLVGGISESNAVAKHVASQQAFWIAEAGLAEALNSIRADNNWTPSNASIAYNNGTYFTERVNNGTTVELRVTGTYEGISRRVKGSLAAAGYRPFENTISTGGDMTLAGFWAAVNVYGKTRLSGSFSKPWGGSEYFEDKQEGVPSANTTLTVPDYNNNSIPDEFSDFVLYGDAVLAQYPSNETLHIVTDGTATIYPSTSNFGKKVIFVEGSTPGTGDVNIIFDASWQPDQDVTIISTGTVTYAEPLQFADNSRLSVVAWEDYYEASIFLATHESVVYAHNNATFIDVLAWSQFTGNVITNENMLLVEALVHEDFYYSNRSYMGDMPPGFGLLEAGGGTSLSSELEDWQEW